jgi:molybdenum cofactor biosynthesis protein B
VTEKRFQPAKIAILTVSDTRTPATDRSGDLLAERAREAGHEVVHRTIVPDDQERIEEVLHLWAKRDDVEVVLTTGGTGVTHRDVTPEAVEAVCTKMIPGFGELFRWVSYETIGTSTVQSRATAGVLGDTYIFALPGSTGACRDAWDRILVQQLDSTHEPCNFMELRPRLLPPDDA